MPSFVNPLKRVVDSEEQGWTPNKRPATATNEYEEYWMVTWRNPQTKKHKTWDGDAVLVKAGNKVVLLDDDGRQITCGSLDSSLEEGKEYNIGGKEIELDRQITRLDCLAGRSFGSGFTSTSTSSSISVARTKFIPPIRKQQDPAAGRKGIPLQPIDLASTSNMPNKAKEQTSEKVAPPSYWTANWRKQQSKAHKTWDGDAYVSHIDGKLTMMSEENKPYVVPLLRMGFTMIRQAPHPGFRTYIGGKEVELDCQIPQSQFPNSENAVINLEDIRVGSAVTPVKNPWTNFRPVYGIPTKPKPSGPLHDPNAEGAVVMKVPTREHIRKHNTRDRPIVPVVLDPIIARRMRDHQKEGVKFLYECTMGLRKHEGQGCILADEMGLGKTLQTIALIWTLLKQNPYSGIGPVVKKVMIVCPVSLVSVNIPNWRSEFYKWLGRDRIGIATCTKDLVELRAFKNSSTHPVLVIGYERLRSMVKDDKLRHFPQVDLIICDEGHRLKSGNNKTTQMFNDFQTRRRIILSGTPIQNDLSEFHAMAEFCNPGLFDDYQTFRRIYELPIIKARAPHASSKEIEIGEARMAQLLTIAKSFVLRRDATLLKDYLPPKHEYVVFITPTQLQLAIFRKILVPEKVEDLIQQSSTAESLALISILTKISNSPILLRAMAENAKGKEQSAFQKRNFMDAVNLIPENAKVDDMNLSGKLIVLSKMLEVILEKTEEKCILVSHYTSTLNVLEAFCRRKRYSYFRLDGQTPQAQRQEYVNAFNKTNQRSGFIFLLSSKAGGVGINLIGASRLCLIDSDWNPSHDLQSMARCHRDGQKRPVFIYRFLTTGAIDEKIYQRQVTKLGLSDSLIGSAAKTSKTDTFTKKDLRDIFRIHTDTPSNTHDLLECPCDERHAPNTSREPTYGAEGPIASYQIDADDMKGEDYQRGFINATQVTPDYLNRLDRADLEKKKAGLAILEEWKHINCLAANAQEHLRDDVLRRLLYKDITLQGTDTRDKDLGMRVDNLLHSIDYDHLLEEINVRSVSEVPGGTISFIFEKTVNKLDIQAEVEE